jgi:hypothetical protein
MSLECTHANRHTHTQAKRRRGEEAKRQRGSAHTPAQPNTHNHTSPRVQVAEYWSARVFESIHTIIFFGPDPSLAHCTFWTFLDEKLHVVMSTARGPVGEK